MSLIFLYLEFFQIGVFAVGGGLATLPFLFHMTHDRFVFIRQTGWLNMEQVGGFVAIAQCAPGAIGVNVAAQTGFLYGGIAGGVIAVTGLISPAIIVIALVSKALQATKNSKITASVFAALRPAAAGLLGAAGWGVWRLALHKPGAEIWREAIRWHEGLVCLAIFALIVKFKRHPIIYVAVGAAAGIAMGLLLP